jgi:CHAT domain-containing protein
LLGSRKAYSPIKKQDVRALVVAVSRPFSSLWGDLISKTEEVKTVKESLPEKNLISVPSTIDSVDCNSGEVTASALLQKLPEATILHLACHGRQDPDNALNSGFVMSDEILTIEKLMRVPLPSAFMAFLSACETAKGDVAST